jgi:hypothetical protein
LAFFAHDAQQGEGEGAASDFPFWQAIKRPDLKHHNRLCIDYVDEIRSKKECEGITTSNQKAKVFIKGWII